MKQPTNAANILRCVRALTATLKGCLTYLTNEFRPNGNETWKVPVYEEAERYLETGSTDVESLLRIAEEIDSRKDKLPRQVTIFKYLVPGIKNLREAAGLA